MYHMQEKEAEMRWSEAELCDMHEIGTQLRLRRGAQEEWS